MNRPLHLRKRLLRYPGFGVLFVVWTLLGGLAWARHSLVSGVQHGNLLPDLLGFLTCYYPWLLFTPLVFRLEQRYPLDGKQWPKNLVCWQWRACRWRIWRAGSVERSVRVFSTY